MGERLKLTVAYDGRPFNGWQSQPNENGVQDHLKRAFFQILSAPVKLQAFTHRDRSLMSMYRPAKCTRRPGWLP